MRKAIEALAGRFHAGTIGSAIRYLETVDSTNRLALALPAAEAPHGLTLVARTQTAGRGRQGRSWLSLPDLGLHFTAVIRPQRSSFKIPLLTLVGALAVYDAIEALCSSPVDIRWPNDVLLDGGKVSGILGEAAYIGMEIERAALGISINLGHRLEDFPPSMKTPPTSILIAEGTAPPLEGVLKLALEGLNRWYDFLALGKEGKILEAMRERSSFVCGRRLLIESGGEKMEVTSAGLNDNGSLQVRLPSGAEISLHSGSVRVLE